MPAAAAGGETLVIDFISNILPHQFPTCIFFQHVSKNAVRRTCVAHIAGSGCLPGLGLLGSHPFASASLALPAPATTAAALRAARPPKAAGLLLRGAGKASEADPRRGKPSKARPGAFHGFFLFCLFGPWALYLAYGLGPPRYSFILVPPVCVP